ncbi:MAG: hypothetical protein WDO56_17110 [Gammaproteobacteria bacterium]
MNGSTNPFASSINHARSANAEALFEAFSEPDLIRDDDIDHAAIAASSQPAQPGGASSSTRLTMRPKSRPPQRWKHFSCKTRRNEE